MIRGCEQDDDEGPEGYKNWGPDYSRRFLVRDTFPSDHPGVDEWKDQITIFDIRSRLLWIFDGDILEAQDTDAFALARITSREPALIYDLSCDVAALRGRWRQ
jgi:hypothetical protein